MRINNKIQITKFLVDSSQITQMNLMVGQNKFCVVSVHPFVYFACLTLFLLVGNIFINMTPA